MLCPAVVVIQNNNGAREKVSERHDQKDCLAVTNDLTIIVNGRFMGEETDNGKQKGMKLFIVFCKLDSSAPRGVVGQTCSDTKQQVKQEIIRGY